MMMQWAIQPHISCCQARTNEPAAELHKPASRLFLIFPRYTQTLQYSETNRINTYIYNSSIGINT